MKKKLFLNKQTIAELNDNAMNHVKGGYQYSDLCNHSMDESCDTNGCAYQTIDEPTCEDPTFTAQAVPQCGPGCFPV